MNLLSVAAAYGVLTAVFEKGWGDNLIGLDRPIPIESFVPLLMFAILFGLSMDYQVFLVSRISEVWHERGDNHAAVVEGLASRRRVITAAAADHGQRLRQLRSQRRPDGEAVRGRPRGRDRGRRHDRALPAGAGGDGAARGAQLVAAGMARAE